MAKIAYVTSGKIGIHSFTHNELSVLEKSHKFVLCLTQLVKGPYMPKSNWNVVIASKVGILSAIIKLALTQPLKFFGLFSEAKKDKHIRELLFALNFFNELKSLDITNIHCQMGDHKLFISYYLKELLSVPLTVTIHAHELYIRELYDYPEKYLKLYNSCDSIITISDFNKNILINDYKIPESKVKVMRLFPEMEKITKLQDKIKILIVANWVEKKGFKVLLQAIKELNRDDISLMIVGGKNKNTNCVDLDTLVPQMELEDNVLILGRFGGELIDVVFSACDIFCLPSYTDYYDDGKPATREGIPVALMEAMAWGKPVISTHHAGIPELVEEVLIEENNVEELKNAIIYLINNRELWQQMGEKNKRIIKEKYSLNNVSVLDEIFEKLEKK